MSIATEISRLQTAKADIKTSIEGKGVTVPSATTLDGYSTLIDSIPTGGGGATEYTITDSYGIYGLTSAGLSQSDFAQGSGTTMWIEFTTAVNVYVYLDEYGDDDFTITIPSGTIAPCTNTYSNGTRIDGVFAFSCGANAPYGWFIVGAAGNGNAIVLSSGENPAYGCAVSTSGYSVGNVGCPNLALINGVTVLHILNYS